MSPLTTKDLSVSADQHWHSMSIFALNMGLTLSPARHARLRTSIHYVPPHSRKHGLRFASRARKEIHRGLERHLGRSEGVQGAGRSVDPC